MLLAGTFIPIVCTVHTSFSPIFQLYNHANILTAFPLSATYATTRVLHAQHLTHLYSVDNNSARMLRARLRNTTIGSFERALVHRLSVGKFLELSSILGNVLYDRVGAHI